MKAELACIPCIMKQAFNTAVRATDDEGKIREILDRTAEYVKTVNLDTTPADASNFAYRITREITENEDPYREDKRSFNDLCLGKLEDLRRLVTASEHPMKTAARLAILGNVIDMGIGFAFDLDDELKNVLERELAVDDFDDFAAFIGGGGKKMMYLLDNAGEIVFDRLLVEILAVDHDVTCVVKRGPIINDATREDADYTGLTGLVKVIDTGSDGIGVKWDEVSDEFVRTYENADVIVSKGQGNFETMSDRDKRTYFLLRAKCDSVASMLGVRFGDVVFKRGPVRGCLQTARERRCW